MLVGSLALGDAMCTDGIGCETQYTLRIHLLSLVLRCMLSVVLYDTL
jgi:hypothetical protein